MKSLVLISSMLMCIVFARAQDVGDPIFYIPWKQVVLHNQANFKNYNDLTWGSGFLLHYHDEVVALTARDLTGTWYSRGEKIEIDQFKEEIQSWKMYVADNPEEFATVDTLRMKDRLEKKAFIFLFSIPILSFSLENYDENIIPLKPDLNRIRNNDTLFIVGYDDSHNLKIEECFVETPLNEKYADQDIRLKTSTYLFHYNFIGAPIVTRNGEVVGVTNRAYYLKKNKKGKIIREDKEEEGAYFEYFMNGTPVRLIFDKKYRKK